ncbi:MAG: LEA type 2 family protein [Gammaproteobacteria bacterium]|nr:LEA type 2 family protein [Gammaproteobacteria bacterium]
MLKIILSCVFVALLSGCAGLETKPAQFKVNISTMKMLESSLMEQRYQVSLRIMNRSKETLNVDGISFDIELNDKDFASGVSNGKFKLEPLSETVVDVTVTSTIFGLIRQVHSFKELESKPLKYELSGSVYTSNSMFGIPFTEQGDINFTP